jgi:16S rRNA (cytidine1402-2'-O)-methyltransferase
MKDQAEDQITPGLYMVATPIGNLEDMSFRAVTALKRADWIAAEDTRETKKLLAAHGIATATVSLHQHSGPRKVAELIEKLKAGEIGAYVSDAGTPGISDPGAELAAAARAAGVPVHPVPGASAPAALLSVAGFPETAFTFHGFFPRERKERMAWLAQAQASGVAVHVFFESPHRFADALDFLAAQAPQTELVVGRELTKKFETIRAGTVAELAEIYAAEEPRGEYVLALRLPAQDSAENEGAAEAKARALLTELAGLGASQKVLTQVGIGLGLAKNRAYALSLEILQK